MVATRFRKCGFLRWFYIFLFGLFLIGSGIMFTQSIFPNQDTSEPTPYSYAVTVLQTVQERGEQVRKSEHVDKGVEADVSSTFVLDHPSEKPKTMPIPVSGGEEANHPNPTQKPQAVPIKLDRYKKQVENVDKKKQRLSRYQRRKEELEKQRRIRRESGDVGPINEVTYEPIAFNQPPISSVKRTKTGAVDTMHNRIDFSRVDWFEQFQYFRELFSSTPSLDEKELQKWRESANGETAGRYTKTFATLANACVIPPGNQIRVFGERGRSVPAEARKALGSPDFYFSPIENVEASLPSDQLHLHGNHTAVFRPRSFSNIYHFLEGSSQLIRLALHPEIFPAITHVVMAGQKAAWYDEWAGFMDYVYLDLFAPSRRPQLHLDRKDPLLKPHQAFCDAFVVVFRNWDAEGAGYFIPEPLAADMVRAAAYKRAGVIPTVMKRKMMKGRRRRSGDDEKEEEKEEDGKLKLLQIRRVNKRRVLNEEELYQAMESRFADKVHIDSKVLEKESAVQQVRRFAALDVLVAAHGAGLTNTIFMLPNSYLVELMPPYWDLACYRRMAENANLGYVLIRSKGKKGPQCDRDPSSQLCRRSGIRDRDFNVTISKVLVEVDRGIRFVQKKKYGV